MGNVVLEIKKNVLNKYCSNKSNFYYYLVSHVFLMHDKYMYIIIRIRIACCMLK